MVLSFKIALEMSGNLKTQFVVQKNDATASFFANNNLPKKD